MTEKTSKKILNIKIRHHSIISMVLTHYSKNLVFCLTRLYQIVKFTHSSEKYTNGSLVTAEQL